MNLTIVNVAYPLATVGPNAVGGAEQVLWMLDHALTAAGHRSIVVAAEGSSAAGELVPMPPMPPHPGPTEYGDAHAALSAAIERIIDSEPVDLVHFHGLDFCRYLPAPGVPVLVTLHLPPSWYPPEALHPTRPGTWLQCVSEAQRNSCGALGESVHVIPNGVSLTPPRPMPQRRSFVLGLGRICPEKGFHLALEAARRARRPMLLAGQVFPFEAHERYFAAEIAPRLDRLRRFVGPVGRRRKIRLLAAARSLVIPSQVAETSSLVAMEALTCGTPVVAYRQDALAEIIDHGRTGFLVESVSEMAEAIEAADGLDHGQCREEARRRFTAAQMTAGYFALYRRLSSAAVYDSSVEEDDLTAAPASC